MVSLEVGERLTETREKLKFIVSHGWNRRLQVSPLGPLENALAASPIVFFLPADIDVFL